MPFYQGTRRILLNAPVVSLVPPVPVISNIASAPDSYYAVIAWTTDVASDSKVQYGLTTGLGSSVTNAALVTSHSVVITGLAQNTGYHFKVGNISGTAISSDQTFTSVRLQLLKAGPFVGASTTFVDTLTDQTLGGTVQTLIASPLEYKNFDLDSFQLIIADTVNGFPNIWVRSHHLSIRDCAGFISDGQAGNDGFITSVCCCVGYHGGGNGGAGASGGGGGGAGDSGQAGGAGGTNGASGDGGEVGPDPNSGGAGGNGFGFEGYTGSEFCLALEPQPGGNGGDTFSCGGGGGGGGGGSAGLTVMNLNEFVNSFAGSAVISAQGGQPGNPVDNADPGTQGGPGFVIIYTRKYDGSFQGPNSGGSWIVEVTGTQLGGFTYTLHTDFTLSWNHLDHP